MSFYQVRVEVEGLFEGEDFSETLNRAKFEELNIDLFRETLKPVKKVKSYISLNNFKYCLPESTDVANFSLALNVQALEDSDLIKKEVDEIVLVSFFSIHFLI